MPDTATLRDNRRSYHFWTDDAVIDEFGSQLGPYGLAVYVAIARHAKQGKAFPATKRLAEITGMSVRSVGRALTQLEELSLITVEPRYWEDGTQRSNLYTLQDLSRFHVPPSIPGNREGDCQTTPPAPQTPSPLPHSHPTPACVTDEGSSVEGSSEEGSPLSISLPPGAETPTHTAPGAALEGEGEKTGFPATAEGMAALKLEVCTPALEGWMQEHALVLPLAHEFERWCAHGLAHGKTYCNMPAAFRHWLLNPLTRRFNEEGASGGGVSSPSTSTTQTQETTPHPSQLAEEAARRKDPAYVEACEEARGTAMDVLGKVLGPAWRAQAEADTRRERKRALHAVPSLEPDTSTGKGEGAA